MIRSSLSRLAVIAAIAGLVCMPARAQEGQNSQDARNGPEDQQAAPMPLSDLPDEAVIAEVGDTDLTLAAARNYMETLPQRYSQVSLAQVFDQIVDQVVRAQLVLDQARAAGLAEDPEVQRRLERAREDILQDVWLRRRLDARLTEERLREAYEEWKAEREGQTEIKARHILVEEKEEAETLISTLRAEEVEFADLASEHSVGPSGARGGDLGYFGEGVMVPAFWEAAQALENGEITQEPVETRFGWHVIKVEDRREKLVPGFEEMRDQLRDRVSRQVLEEILSGLVQQAEVTTYSLDEIRARGGEAGGEGEGGSAGAAE